jgi:hypothetical protein
MVVLPRAVALELVVVARRVFPRGISVSRPRATWGRFAAFALGRAEAATGWMSCVAGMLVRATFRMLVMCPSSVCSK